MLENFNKSKPSTIPMAQFNSNYSNESDQDARTTATHMYILLQFLLTKHVIYPLLTAMWDHTNGCAKQYCCASTIMY